MKYIVALDQGTTSSRAIVFDHDQNIVAVGQKEFGQIYPQPGWVEHDPMEIWATQYGVLQEALIKAGITMADVAGIGITNQRETTIVWEKKTGKPIYNAIVWQCRRTADLCEQLKAEGWEDYIRANTGLVIDAYFSATKINWILDHVPGARERAKKGELLFGTVDSWLVWKLTNGAVHVTDYTRPVLCCIIFEICNGMKNCCSGLIFLFVCCRKCAILQKFTAMCKVKGRRCPYPVLPATNRRRCSGRHVLNRVRQRIPMAPAVFC